MIDFLKGTVTPKDWIALAGILGAAAALAAVYFFVIYSGQQERLAAIAAENELIVKDLTKARETNEAIERLRDDTKAIELLVKDFEERLPSDRELVSLFREVETMAIKEGLRPTFTSLPPMRDAQNRKETIPYKVTVLGGYHQIAGYLNSLERYRRYLKITDIAIGASEEGLSEATFKLNTFRFIKAVAAPGASK